MTRPKPNLSVAKGDIVAAEICSTMSDVGLYSNCIVALHSNSKELPFTAIGTASYELDGVAAVDVVGGHTMHADFIIGLDNGKTPTGVVPFVAAKEVKIASPFTEEKKTCNNVDGYASAASDHELGVDHAHHRGPVRDCVDTKIVEVRN